MEPGAPIRSKTATAPVPPFSVREPAGRETAVVVEVPHAGLGVTPANLATLIAPARSLAVDADLYVDELYADAPDHGATLLVSHVSRYVCDLNRAEPDVDSRAVSGAATHNSPHGLVWIATTEGAPALSRPLTAAEFENRLTSVYQPYHGALANLLERKRRRFGFAVLLCGHSMPSRGRGRGHRARADIVPGSRGRTTASPIVIDCPDALARERGWSVAHDDPYRGGFTTAHYGKPSRGVHAVQVEISRRLYMDELSLLKLPNAFESVRHYCRTLVARLGELTLASP
jgi:N-formylglutamate deformylase